MIQNARIEKIGLHYMGHGGVCSIEIRLSGGGWGSTITLPVSRADELFKTFQYTFDDAGKNFEDGVFLQDLEGEIVRVKFDKDTLFQSRPVAIGEALAEEDEFLSLSPAEEDN